MQPCRFCDFSDAAATALSSKYLTIIFIIKFMTNVYNDTDIHNML